MSDPPAEATLADALKASLAKHRPVSDLPAEAITANFAALQAMRKCSADHDDDFLAECCVAAGIAEAVQAERARHLAEYDALREHLTGQFPPCPRCGCRTFDDPDARECGCDAGCNDATSYPPGVTVLLNGAVQAERDRMAGILRDIRRAALQGGQTGETVRAEIILILDNAGLLRGES